MSDMVGTVLSQKPRLHGNSKLEVNSKPVGNPSKQYTPPDNIMPPGH